MSPEQTTPHSRIIAKLGEGGMVGGYRESNAKLNREVAMKPRPHGAL